MKDKDSARLFILSFMLTLFIVSLMYLFMTVTVHPHAPPERQIAAEEAYIPREEDALTLMFFGTQIPGGVAETYILLRFDPVRRRILVVPFLPQTEISYAGGNETLAYLYRFGGAQYASDALSEYLQIQIDRFVRISMSNFILAANVVGRVEYEIEEEMTLIEGDAVITLNPGLQLLDGRMIATIVTQPGLTPEERAALTGKLAAAGINQRIDIVRSTLIDAVFERIINLIDTNISFIDYEQRKAPAIFIADEDNPAELILPDGVWADDVFRLHDTFIARLAHAFNS